MRQKTNKQKTKNKGVCDCDFSLTGTNKREKKRELGWLVDIWRQFVVWRSVKRAFFFNIWHTAPSNHFPSPIARPRVTVQILCAKENASLFLSL